MSGELAAQERRGEGTGQREAEVVAGGGPDAGQGGGRTSFWASVPGVLTALAGLVTAVGTAAAVYFGGGGGGGEGTTSPPPTNPPQVVVLSQPPALPPPGDAPIRTSESNRAMLVSSGQAPPGVGTSGADQIIEEWTSTLDDETIVIAEGCGAGLDGDCQQMLEILVGKCEVGYPLDCDVLFLASPQGSELGAYGNTCGGRMDENNGSWCRDLVSN